MTGRRGAVDQCVIAWELEGKIGQNRLIPGSVMQDPTTYLQVGSHKDLARIVMAGLRQLGIELVRIGAGDDWAGRTQWDAWKFNPDAFFGIVDNWADAALAEGMQIIFTCLGFADAETYHRENEPLWRNDSPEQQAANEYVGAVARHFRGHAGVYAIEWGNETDHDLIAYNYWLRNFPDYYTRLAAYCSFVKHALETSTALAGDGAPPIIMGHALIGAMFCVAEYHYDAGQGRYIVDRWDFTRGDRAFLKEPNRYQKIGSAHIYYFGAPLQDFKADLPASFAKACRELGIPGLVGEYGDLRNNAAWYVQGVEQVFMDLGLDSCAMRLAPRAGFPLSSLPTPAPQTPVETPAPVADPVSSSNPSDPAQEPPDEPGATDGVEQPAAPQEPALEPSPGEELSEDPASGDEASTPDPTPRGRGLVFVQIMQWAFELIGRLIKIKPRSKRGEKE